MTVGWIDNVEAASETFGSIVVDWVGWVFIIALVALLPMIWSNNTVGIRFNAECGELR